MIKNMGASSAKEMVEWAATALSVYGEVLDIALAHRHKHLQDQAWVLIRKVSLDTKIPHQAMVGEVLLTLSGSQVE
ncbi:hypothetical protein GGI07_001904, partial [Coemansia sp. Benny D115]